MKRSHLIALFSLLSLLVSCDGMSDSSSFMPESTSPVSSAISIPDYGLGFVSRPAYDGILTVRAFETQVCEEGLIYRENTSGRDFWLGLETTITLPTFTADLGQSDKFSIYYKVISEHASSIGLIFVQDELPHYQPFWEYVIDGDFPVSFIADPGNHRYYPGDKIRMSVFSEKENSLRLIIELLEPSELDLYSEIGRENSNVVFDEFISSYHVITNTAYKRRVEIKPGSIESEVKVENAVIESSYLYRLIDGAVYKLPFNYKFAYLLNCGRSTHEVKTAYTRVYRTQGGEEISILPVG